MFHPSEDWLPALPKQKEIDHLNNFSIELATNMLKIESVNESYLADPDEQECMTKF